MKTKKIWIIFMIGVVLFITCNKIPNEAINSNSASMGQAGNQGMNKVLHIP